MSSINTNIPSLIAQDALRTSARDMDKAMERLSTGKRINSGADDPAGLGMAARITSSALSTRQGERNANDAISMLHLYSETGEVIIDILMKMKELATMAGSDPYSIEDRITLDERFNILGKEWARLPSDTRWNVNTARMDTFDGSFDVRLDEGSTPMTMTLKSWDPTNRTANQNITGATAIVADDSNARVDWAWGFDQVLPSLETPPRANQKSHSHIQSQAAARNAVTKLQAMIDGAVTEVAQYGSYIRRLEFAASYSRDVATEAEKAVSKIVDADYARESTELSRAQIISQAATAVLAQANLAPQTLLSLLQ